MATRPTQYRFASFIDQLSNRSIKTDAVPALSGTITKTRRRPCVFKTSCLLEEFRAQHQTLDLVGTAFNLVFIVSEMDVLYHGPTL